MSNNQDDQKKPEEIPADDDKGFEEGFAAASSGEGLNEEPDAEDDEQSSEGDNKTDADGENDQQASDPQAGTSDPAKQPGSFDPWSDLSPESREYFSRLQHSELSQRGRVAALTKKLKEVGGSKPAPKIDDQQKDDAAKVESAEGDVGEIDKRLQQAVEDYPDAVGPLVEVIEQMRGELSSIKGQVNPISADREAENLALQYAELEKVHPDYATIASDATFQQWLADQPDNLKTMAQSFDARETSMVLTLFKTENKVATMMADQQSAQTNVNTGLKRQRQLDAAKQVSSKGGQAAQHEEDSFDAGFAAAARKKD